MNSGLYKRWGIGTFKQLDSMELKSFSNKKCTKKFDECCETNTIESVGSTNYISNTFSLDTNTMSAAKGLSDFGSLG